MTSSPRSPLPPSPPHRGQRHLAVPSPVQERINQACTAVGDFIAYWGFKSIYGKVWALLAMRREPTAQIEIAELLGVSRSLVSAAVAELHRLGLVRPTNEHRNAPYVAVMDVWPTISDVLRSREWMLLESARLALEAALEEVHVAKERGIETAYDVGRMRVLLTMTTMAQGLLKMLIALRTPRTVANLRDWGTRAAELIRGVRGAW